MKLSRIENELSRLNADEGTGGLCADTRGDKIMLWDDHEKVVGKASDIFSALAELPDGAGFEATWQALADITEDTIENWGCDCQDDNDDNPECVSDIARPHLEERSLESVHDELRRNV